MNFKKMKKSTSPSGKNVFFFFFFFCFFFVCLFFRMAEPAQQFSLGVFENSGKVYISTENLAVRRIYLDPDRLLFMFDQPYF